MGCYKNKILVILITLHITALCIRSAPLNLFDLNVTSEGDLNGDDSIELGKKLECPNGYTVTKNGFCMKVYSDKPVKQDAAEQQCQKDGGHLVNIDSDLKFEDVRSLLTGFTRSSAGLWIDGYRKEVGSPWQFTYGSQAGFFKWYAGKQYNPTKEDVCLAIALYSIGVKWHDDPCYMKYYPICEISESK